MSRLRPRWATLPLALLLAAGALSEIRLAVAQEPAYAQSDSLEEATKRRELEEVRRKAAEQREAAQRLKGQESKAVGQLRRADRALGLTRKRLKDLARRRRDLDSQLEFTRVDLQRNLTSLAAQKAQLAKRLREI
jgi:hypothetical protein